MLRERRWWVWITVAAVLGTLLVVDVVLYSLYKALQSRSQGQDHRIERLEKMVTDMIQANQNAEKIEKIETQVDGIEVQVTELTSTIKEQDAKAQSSKSKKKRRRRH